MVGTIVRDATRHTAGRRWSRRRTEVAAARAAGDEDFDALESVISVRHLDFFYGKEQALFDNTLEIKKNRVTAVIGPSGCGKSTHIRTYNRIFELYRDQQATGEIIFDGANILSPQTDLLDLRRRIGMIFQKPSPVPDDRVRQRRLRAAPALQARTGRSSRDRVEDALKRSALWDEVKHKLDEPGNALSGGQQQRLCIARAIATEPEVRAHGRALLGHRPGRDGQDRGAHRRAQEPTTRS